MGLRDAAELIDRIGAGLELIDRAVHSTAQGAESLQAMGGGGGTRILTRPVSPGAYSPWSRGTILGVNGQPIGGNYTGIGSPGGPSGNLVGNSGTPGVGGGAFSYPIVSGGLGLGEGMPGVYNPTSPPPGYGGSGFGKVAGPVPTIDATAPTQVRLLAQVAQGVQQLVAQTKSDNGASLRAKGLV